MYGSNDVEIPDSKHHAFVEGVFNIKGMGWFSNETLNISFQDAQELPSRESLTGRWQEDLSYAGLAGHLDCSFCAGLGGNFSG